MASEGRSSALWNAGSHLKTHMMFESEGSSGGGGGAVPKMENRGGRLERGCDGTFRRRWEEHTLE